MTTERVRQRREHLVLEHMQSENEHRFDDTLATFSHPRYELIPSGQVIDGLDAVSAYYRAGRAVIPDQRNELIQLHHMDDGVAAEFTLRGTHEGELRGMPPTGKEFECRMVALFLFEPDSDRIVCERVYFDAATIFAQLAS